MLKKLWIWYKKPHKTLIEQLAEIVFIILPFVFLIRTIGFGLYQVPSESMESTMLVGERFFSDKFTVLFKPIQRGEIIAINDPTYKYSSNKIIHLWQRYVWGPSNWTKRVIGIPGDHVEGKLENGHPVIYLNGKKLDEPYLNKYPILAVWTQNVPTIQDIYLARQGNNPKFDYPMTWRSYDPTKSHDKQPCYAVDPSKIVTVADFDNLRYPDTNNGDDVFDVQLGDNEYWLMGDNRRGSFDSRGWGKLDGTLIHGRIIFRIWSIDSDASWWILDFIKNPIKFWKKIRWSRCLQTL